MKSQRRTVIVASAHALVVAALLLGACRGERTTQPQPGPTAHATAAAQTPGGLPEVRSLRPFEAFAALGYQPEWIGYPVVPRGRKILYLDAYDDLILVHESGNSVTVMDAATGANRWSLSLAGDLTLFVGNTRLANGDLVCSSQGEVFVLDPGSGIVKERNRLAVIANTRPVAFGRLLVYGCATGEVLGHNLASGYKQWGYMLDGTITARPVRVGDVVAAVSQGGEWAALDPIEGSAVGRGRIFGGLANHPVASEDGLFIAGLDQSIWAFAPTQREPRWRVRTEHPIRQQPVLHAGRLYVVLEREGLACFDAADGSRRWTTAGLSGHVAAVRAGRLIVWDGHVAALVERESGEVLERIVLPGIDRLTTDRLEDGRLYAYSLKGEVQKYSPRR